MNVLLESNTVGYVENANIGETVTVTFHDENGMTQNEIGVVVEIL